VDGLETEAGGDDGFDADVALFTGELRRLLPDLVEALGGINDRQPAATDEAGVAPAGDAPF
jgi:recombination associated protein RdgC